jgi:hypothetical protein
MIPATTYKTRVFEERREFITEGDGKRCISTNTTAVETQCDLWVESTGNLLVRAETNMVMFVEPREVKDEAAVVIAPYRFVEVRLLTVLYVPAVEQGSHYAGPEETATIAASFSGDAGADESGSPSGNQSDERISVTDGSSVSGVH